MSAPVARLNPKGLHRNPAFSQAVAVTSAVERSGAEQARVG